MLSWISLLQVAEGLAAPAGLREVTDSYGSARQSQVRARQVYPKASYPSSPTDYNNSLISFPILLILCVGVGTAMSTHMSSCAFGGQRCRITLELTL